MPDPRDELLARLTDVTRRDEQRLRRRFDRRDSDLAAFGREVARAEDRIARRRARVPIVSYPDELPVSARVDDIAAAIRENQVVVVAGETGSGKTTQLPKLCLAIGRGVRGAIAHTQPRRIAARAVAERLAEELDVPLGQAVGYQVRFTRQTSSNTLIKVMTDGVLLAEIAHDPELLSYDTVIVDEAHERSLNIDFLLGYLSQLLPRRPDLRVIITSATIDPQRFADHFGGVPIIEVSGRTYPVEVRYRPYDEAEIDQVQAVIDAVAQLPPAGDALVFLSGERQIRDTADAMNRLEWPGTEIVPLFGRLSAAEQHRVFASHAGRRIVLATNVAETSLTVPGIRYVVDTGTARISRYSHRLKVQRLPIERISQASAQQRAGRCGRVADGICIRLYDEEDFRGRPAYTDPEIMRTNLAAVILAMAALDLGDVADFPFLDPPDRRSVNDGVALLSELGALANREPGRPRLTELGRRLARLPLDPRLGRMVLEAAELGCLREVVIITAALTIQDPRERPSDAPEQADASHRRFADDSSDVMALLGLWRYLEEQQEALSGSAFRRLCRAEFLHYLRIREWQDLVAQLRDVVTRDLGLTETAAARADPDRVHRALLAGLLSHIGLKEPDGRDYLGARGVHFVLWPGSALARKQPRWVMAAELVETSRLFARTVARIEPQWIEDAAAHLVVRTYSEPRWDAERGAVMAFEKVTLYGVPLVARRRVGYARVSPEVSRELFLRHALVEGDWRSHHAFLERNQQTLGQLQTFQAKARRRDLVVDDNVLLDFYDHRVPASVVSARHFDAWWKRARHETADLLDLSLDDLLAGGALPEPSQFPDTWRLGDVDIALTYRFAPGELDDGVTAQLPVTVLNRLPPAVFSWQVPGLRHDLATALIRGLPKAMRRLLVPAPDTATAALAQLSVDAQRPFEAALGAAIRRDTGLDIPFDAWSRHSLPPHLRVHLAVTDGRGRVLGTGDEFEPLRSRLAPTLRRAIAEIAPNLERSGLRSWPGDALARTVDSERDGLRVTGFPALVDEGGSVGVRVLPSVHEQAAAMARGTRRLLLLTIGSPAKPVLDRLSATEKLSLARDSGGRPAEVVRDCIAAAVDELVAQAGGPAWDAAGFATLRAGVAAELVTLTASTLAVVAEVHEAAHDLRQRLAAAAPELVQPSYDDLRHQLDDLVPLEVATALGVHRLPAVVRYLRAMQRRLDRLPQDVAKDAAMMDRVHAVEDVWHDALDRLTAGSPVPAELGEVRWMLEELRVSLFAQLLGTAYPVSEKRVLTVLGSIGAPR